MLRHGSTRLRRGKGRLSITDRPRPPTPPTSSRQGQLAFSGNPLKGFRRAFDPVLAVVAFCRKLPDDLIGATGRRARDVARGEIDRRPDRELVLQRPLLLACRQEPLVPLPGPACLYNFDVYSTPERVLTSGLPPGNAEIASFFNEMAP